MDRLYQLIILVCLEILFEIIVMTGKLHILDKISRNCKQKTYFRQYFQKVRCNTDH